MKKQLIAVATIKFDEAGTVQWSKVESRLEVCADQEFIDKHQEEFQGEEEKVKVQSEHMLSLLFTKMTQIELRDIDKDNLSVEYKCTKQENGKVDKCTIKYYITE